MTPIPWLLKTWRGYRLQAVLNASIGIVLVLLDLSFVWATKTAVDIATGANPSLSLYASLAILAAIVAAQVAVGLLSRRIRATLGLEAQNRMQLSLFRKLLGTGWQQLRSFHTGDLLNRIEQDVRDVVVFLTENLPSLLTTLVQLIGAFLLLYSMDRTLALIILVVVPFFLLCSKLYFKKMRRLTHTIRSSESQMQSVIQESLQHALVVKTLERTPYVASRLSAMQRAYRSQVLSKANYSILSAGIVNSGFAIGYLATFFWGVVHLQSQAITYGTLLAFIQLVGQIQAPARSLTKFVPLFISAFTAADRLIAVSSLPAEAPGTPLRLNAPVGIRLQGVTFAYSPSSRNVFNGFCCHFPPGTTTAILGPTGTGKTTLIRILLALTPPPQQGRATIYAAPQHPSANPVAGACPGRGEGENECPISPLTRCNFSYVPQGNTLLSGTIRDNLLMGNPHASDQQMLSALSLAQANFVSALPLGLDTPCGEMGGGLSEGQAQRVAIARALLRDSPVLLLDEATSALDEQTERRLLQALAQRYAHRKTIICITHRPEVLQYCDNVITL